MAENTYIASPEIIARWNTEISEKIQKAKDDASNYQKDYSDSLALLNEYATKSGFDKVKSDDLLKQFNSYYLKDGRTNGWSTFEPKFVEILTDLEKVTEKKFPLKKKAKFFNDVLTKYSNFQKLNPTDSINEAFNQIRGSKLPPDYFEDVEKILKDSQKSPKDKESTLNDFSVEIEEYIDDLPATHILGEYLVCREYFYNLISNGDTSKSSQINQEKKETSLEKKEGSAINSAVGKKEVRVEKTPINEEKEKRSSESNTSSSQTVISSPGELKTLPIEEKIEIPNKEAKSTITNSSTIINNKVENNATSNSSTSSVINQPTQTKEIEKIKTESIKKSKDSVINNLEKTQSSSTSNLTAASGSGEIKSNSSPIEIKSGGPSTSINETSTSALSSQKVNSNSSISSTNNSSEVKGGTSINNSSDVKGGDSTINLNETKNTSSTSTEQTTTVSPSINSSSLTESTKNKFDTLDYSTSSIDEILKNTVSNSSIINSNENNIKNKISNLKSSSESVINSRKNELNSKKNVALTQEKNIVRQGNSNIKNSEASNNIKVDKKEVSINKPAIQPKIENAVSNTTNQTQLNQTSGPTSTNESSNLSENKSTYIDNSSNPSQTNNSTSPETSASQTGGGGASGNFTELANAIKRLERILISGIDVTIKDY